MWVTHFTFEAKTTWLWISTLNLLTFKNFFPWETTSFTWKLKIKLVSWGLLNWNFIAFPRFHNYLPQKEKGIGTCRGQSWFLLYFLGLSLQWLWSTVCMEKQSCACCSYLHIKCLYQLLNFPLADSRICVYVCIYVLYMYVFIYACICISMRIYMYFSD